MDTKKVVPAYSRMFEGPDAETAAFSQALVLIHTAHFSIVSMGKTDVQVAVLVTRKDKVWTVEGGLYDLEEQPKEQQFSEKPSEKILQMPNVKDGA